MSAQLLDLITWVPIFTITLVMILAMLYCMVEYNISDVFAQEIKSKNNSVKNSLEPDIIQDGWNSSDKNTLIILAESKKPITDARTLSVKVLMAASEIGITKLPWSIVSTNYISADNYREYEYNLSVSTQDVNQLHSKVLYFDSNKNELQPKRK